MLMPMWRKHRLVPFTLLTLMLGGLLSACMFGLAYILFLNLLAEAFSRSLLSVLLVLVVVSSVLIVLALVQFVYVTHTTSRDRDQERRILEWDRDLRQYASGERQDLPRRLDDVGGDVLLMLREELGPTPESDRLAQAYDEAGRRERDEDSAVNGRHPNTRAFALERLALLRSPQSLPLLLNVAEKEERDSLRNLAMLAATQILGHSQQDPLLLLPALTSGHYTAQQGREALNLLGERAAPLIRALSQHEETGYRDLAADTAAYMDAPGYADVARRLLHDPEPTVQASALKIFAEGAAISEADKAVILEKATAPEWFVRAQAASAMAHFSPLPLLSLWELLGDPQWWVRLNAGRSLATDPQGLNTLVRATTEHKDRFARDMARATLEAEA